MLKRLLQLLPGQGPAQAAPEVQAEATPPAAQQPPPAVLQAPGVAPLDFAALLNRAHGMPVPDWPAVAAWVAEIPEAAAQAQAWAEAELAWLAHLQTALGPQYHVTQHEHALLLSTLEPRVAAATVQFMTRTLTRIELVLEGVAQTPEWGRDILLVFEDQDSYYRYVARYYPDNAPDSAPESREFAFSSGMHINFGCSHFAAFQAELHTIEPVIAHEMTHACLGHLAIPAWLNEGLAVNTERRLCPPPGQPHSAHELHAMHQQFWTETTVQEFWSGQSFLRPDEGNLLSYELARILTEQFARDWPAFQRFANQAQIEDAGHAAALQVLGVDLGATVCALFGFEATGSWSPDPSRWPAPPERGAF